MSLGDFSDFGVSFVSTVAGCYTRRDGPRLSVRGEPEKFVGEPLLSSVNPGILAGGFEWRMDETAPWALNVAAKGVGDGVLGKRGAHLPHLIPGLCEIYYQEFPPTPKS